MASFWYFIKEILLQHDPEKIQKAPPRITFFAPYLILEVLSILGSTIYLFPHLSSDSSWYTILLIIIWLALIMIIITLFIDLLCTIRKSIILDLQDSLRCDRRKSALHGGDYRYYAEHMAYRSGLYRTDNSKCTICSNEYIDDDIKSLLYCGHLFHKTCLRNYEYRHSKDNVSKCPRCKLTYRTNSAPKWDWNENYWDTIPWYLQRYNYYGEKTMRKLYWNPIGWEYNEYQKEKDVSKRPTYWERNKNIIIAIISNLRYLGNKKLWKIIKFTKESTEGLIEYLSQTTLIWMEMDNNF